MLPAPRTGRHRHARGIRRPLGGRARRDRSRRARDPGILRRHGPGHPPRRRDRRGPPRAPSTRSAARRRAFRRRAHDRRLHRRSVRLRRRVLGPASDPGRTGTGPRAVRAPCGRLPGRPAAYRGGPGRTLRAAGARGRRPTVPARVPPAGTGGRIHRLSGLPAARRTGRLRHARDGPAVRDLDRATSRRPRRPAPSRSTSTTTTCCATPKRTSSSPSSSKERHSGDPARDIRGPVRASRGPPGRGRGRPLRRAGRDHRGRRTGPVRERADPAQPRAEGAGRGQRARRRPDRGGHPDGGRRGGRREPGLRGGGRPLRPVRGAPRRRRTPSGGDLVARR